MDRVAALTEAWQVAADNAEGAPVLVPTDSGMVAIVDVRPGFDGDVGWVDVEVDDPVSGDPLFRVVNPPTLVADPDGDVEVSGQRYRSDPVAALAQVIGTAGAARTGRGW